MTILNNKTLVLGLMAVFLVLELFSGAGTVSAQTSTALSCNSITLDGTAIPVADNPLTASFEYGTTQSFGSRTPSQTFNTTSNYSQTITGLSESTTYYFRAVGVDTTGTFYGSTLSFTTPACSSGTTPTITVTTNLATNVYQASATLNGFVTKSSNTLNNVNAWFEWGTTQTFGNTTSQSFITGVSSIYSQTISGLNANTVYYYRAVAQSGSGAFVYGATQTFTTGSLNTNTNNQCYINGVWQNCNNSGGNNQCYINGTWQACSNSSGQPYVTTYSATGVGDTFGVLNGYVDPNGYYTTRWFEWGTQNGYLGSQTIRNTQGLTSGPFNQTLTGLSPNTTYYFRAVAQGPNGVVYGNILSFTTTGGGNTYNTGGGTNLDVVTTLATNIGYTSGRINGLALINNNTATPANTNAYFEWGTNSSLNTSQSTPTQAIGNAPSVTFYASLFNLQPNTRYYYRAVATNSNGTAKGSILSFVTSSTASVSTNTSTIITTPTPRPSKNTNNLTVRNNLSQQSLMGLSIDRNGSCDQRGDTLEFIVTYKNTSNKVLRDVVLSVILPGELDFIDASRGAYSDTDRTVVNPIGIVNPGEEGIMKVRAQVSRDAQIGKTIVITADLVDTDATTGAQEEVVAYSLNTICSNGGVLGAATFFGGDGFFPTTLCGWLLIVLIILALLLLIRTYYGKREVVK